MENGYRLPEPTLQLKGPYGLDFLRAFVEGMQEAHIEYGLKIPEDKTIQAIKEHLEDMRKLIFESRIK